jgi:Tetracyclin repressor-like, C-terminal domain/Bacterial regulatory proteins, tetR family
MTTEYNYSGRSDPQRSLQLLWRLETKPRRGPKPGLTLDRIVETAIGVADAEGLQSLSMRRVAEELGVGTMSLYRYVPAKAELLDLMVDAVDGEVLRAEETPTAGEWRDKLEHFAHAAWAGYHRHPWVLQIVAADARPPLGPNVMDGFESLLASVSGIGLTGSEMVAVTKLISGYVVGVARSSIEAIEVVRETGVTEGQWWSERNMFWEEIFDVERFPTLTQIYESGGFDKPEDDFQFGLQRVLDGIEALVEERR